MNDVMLCMFFGVGVGLGDLELVIVKIVCILCEVDVIFVFYIEVIIDGLGCVESIIIVVVFDIVGCIRCIFFLMWERFGVGEKCKVFWQVFFDVVVIVFDEGVCIVVFVIVGDLIVFFIFIYLCVNVEERLFDVIVELSFGIIVMQVLLVVFGCLFVEGKEILVFVLVIVGISKFGQVFDFVDLVVIYKGGCKFFDVVEQLCSWDCQVVIGIDVILEFEQIIIFDEVVDVQILLYFLIVLIILECIIIGGKL